MNERTIEIIYSPILKEKIDIKQNGKSFSREIGAWQRVYNKLRTSDGANKFLQEIGKDFFDELYNALFGVIPNNKILVDMQTTGEVFKDFESMANWYNRLNNREKIFIRQLTKEFPSNEETVKKIAEIANEVESLLKTENESIKNDNNKTYEDINSGIIKLHRALIDTSDSNMISLCVTGVYSSGKSAFINALLGEELLEENDDPSTAAFFSIKKNKTVSIEFIVESPEYEEILLESDGKKLNPKKAIKNKIIKDELLPELRPEKTIVEQIRIVSVFINKMRKNLDNEVDFTIQPDITISYPFDLGGSIPVKICDTPGTNSSFKNDSEVIEEALANQKNSILITIINPLKSDDRQGNNLLFNIIDKADKENTYIDKSRLFIIWNSIDGQYSDEDKVNAKKSKIIEIEKGNEIKKIKLDEYPLFFISSKRALSAKKLLENSDDKKWTKCYKNSDVDINLSKHCSLGWLSDKIHDNSEKALKDAGKNEYKQALVMSGLFAVKAGITDYINKYSGAIRADGMYKAVVGIVRDLELIIKDAKSKQKEAKDGAYNKFEEARIILQKSIKNACTKEKKPYIKAQDNNAKGEKAKAFINSLKEKLDELYEKKYDDEGWLFSRSLKDYHREKNNNKLLNKVKADIIRFVNEKIEKENNDLKNETQKVFDAITEEIKNNFQKVMSEDSWNKIKNNVFNNIPTITELNVSEIDKLPGWILIPFWTTGASKLKKDDFKEKIVESVMVGAATLISSLTRFDETIIEVIDGICKSYLENLEDYSNSLKRFKIDADKEAEKLDKIEKLFDKISGKSFEIENIVFNNHKC